MGGARKKSMTRNSLGKVGASLLLLALAAGPGCVLATDDDGATTSAGQGGGATGGGGPGGGGQGGAGGAEPDPLEPVTLTPSNVCEGAAAVTLAPGQVGVATATTIDAGDELDTFCADVDAATAAPDVVFAVTLSSACTLRAAVYGMGAFDPALSIRLTECGTEGPSDQCVNRSPYANEYQDLGLEAGTYWFVVDGAAGSAGDFEIELACYPTTCGDGVINAGEDCDPGDPYDADGCIDPGQPSACRFESAPASLDSCAGAEATAGTEIGAGQTLWLPAEGVETTIGSTDDGTGSCAGSDGGMDHIYRLRPTAAGTLTLVLGEERNGDPSCPEDLGGEFPPSCFDRALHVRTTCATAETEVACSDSAEDPAAVETVQLEVTAGTDYYVFVDGYDGDPLYSAGQYAVRATLE